jgi:integrase
LAGHPFFFRCPSARLLDRHGPPPRRRPLAKPSDPGTDYHLGNYVFTFEDGRPPHPDTIRQRFDRLAAAAGLSRITFHDLRHYADGRVMCPAKVIRLAGTLLVVVSST